MIGLRAQTLCRMVQAGLWLKQARSLVGVMRGPLPHALPNGAITTRVRRLTRAEPAEEPGDLREMRRTTPPRVSVPMRNPLQPGIGSANGRSSSHFSVRFSPNAHGSFPSSLRPRSDSLKIRCI